MTNKAQAKPTKDPKDPIQHRSLLTPAFICAVLVVLSLAWLVWHDFVATKPWKSYQDDSRHIHASFLQEKLFNQRNALSVDGDGVEFTTRTRQELEAAIKVAQADYQAMFVDVVEKIGQDIENIDLLLKAIEADVGAKFWLKERRSIHAEARFLKEHGTHKMSDDIYRAIADEIAYRGDLVTKLRFNNTVSENRKAELLSAVSALQNSLARLNADVDSSKKQLAALSNKNKDYIQIFKQHQGKNDIVDRCQTCHDGTLNPTFSREEMWGSHLSNHMVRGFFDEYKEKNFWAFKDQRLEQISQLATVNGEVGEGDRPFLKSAPSNGLNADNASEFLAIAKFNDVEALFSELMSDEAVKTDVLFGWHKANLWRGNPMLDPNQVVVPAPVKKADEASVSEEEESEDADGVSLPPASVMADPALVNSIKKYGVMREEGPYLANYDPNVATAFPLTRENAQEFGSDTPAMLLAAEVWVYLASNGPFTLDGIFAYPDRYGFADKAWFKGVVNDVRVQELYRMAYRKFSHYMKEKFLMFTAHPRFEKHIANHDPAKFGCTSCHRGTGINTKSVESAHGFQHHWLMPLYQEGYQEAGCQKCHQAEIELENSTRLQKGKDLYQQMGCWGCHSYEGYDAEGGEQIRTAKAVRDTTAAIESLRESYAEVQAKIAGVSKGSQAYQAFMETLQTERGMNPMEALTLANSIFGNRETALGEELASLQRQEATLAQSLRASHSRIDELDIERKKRGPNLKDLALKVPEEQKGWVANWIRYPKAFRPSTRMPHFFYGPFSFIDELRVDANGAPVDADARAEAFSEHGLKDGMANPLYRRHRKHDVDMIKGVARHIWQASKAAKDLGDVAQIQSHAVPSDVDSIDAGRTIFASNCISCHSIEPDLVTGSTVLPMIDLNAEPHHGQLPVVYESITELVAAPKYAYRIDGAVQLDGHGNPMRNEFIYGFAANLSRVGEKASTDYLVEWVLQPRLRNKHAIMPSFWPSLAGTPTGADRDDLNKSIAEFEAKLGELNSTGRLLYADAKRRRGDIDGASIALYRETIGRWAEGMPVNADAAATEPNVDVNLGGPNAALILELRRALKDYDQAKKVVAYLATLKHTDANALDLKSPQSGYIENYTYQERVFVPDDQGGANPTAGMEPDFQLKDAPTGHYEFQEIEVTGFEDYSFMDEGYGDYLNSRKARRAAAALREIANDIVALTANAVAAKYEPVSESEKGWLEGETSEQRQARIAALQDAMAHPKRERANALLANRVAEFEAAMAALEPWVLSLNGELNFAAAKERETWETDQITEGLTAAYESLAIHRAGLLNVDNEVTRASRYVGIADALKQIQIWGTKYEGFTLAGDGAVYTRQYGCAGCHEIEGFESEARIGVELTAEGSKFIQRLDFGLLESHQELDDHHTPRSPLWVPRGSLRAYDPSHIKAENGTYTIRVPENLPYVRGGKGFEMPEGVRQRYIHSKFHYRTRPAWFQGKLHNPRQWDKGRLLEDDSSFLDRTRMPLFELDEEELLALTTFIEGSESLKPWGEGSPEIPRIEYYYNYKENADAPGVYDDKVKGWWIVKKYNCIGCHSLGENEGRYRRLVDNVYGAFGPDRFATDGINVKSLKLVDKLENVPPTLHDAGARLRGEWLIDWLRNPQHIRNTSYNATAGGLLGQWYEGNYRQTNEIAPMVEKGERRYYEHVGADFGEKESEARVRMPHFYLTESEARSVQAFLSYMASVPKMDSGRGKRPSEEAIAFGSQIFTAGGCNACHGESEFKAGYFVPGGRAPNLNQVPTRIRRDWLRSWLRNPGAIQPGTAMPSFFTFDVATQKYRLSAKPSGEGTMAWDKLGATGATDVPYQEDHLEALIDWLMWGNE